MAVRLHHKFCCVLIISVLINELMLNIDATGGHPGTENPHLNIKREEGEGVVVKTIYGSLAGFKAFIPPGNGFDEEHSGDKGQSLPVHIFLGIRFARAQRFEVFKQFGDYEKFYRKAQKRIKFLLTSESFSKNYNQFSNTFELELYYIC